MIPKHLREQAQRVLDIAKDDHSWEAAARALAYEIGQLASIDDQQPFTPEWLVIVCNFVSSGGECYSRNFDHGDYEHSLSWDRRYGWALAVGGPGLMNYLPIRFQLGTRAQVTSLIRLLEGKSDE